MKAIQIYITLALVVAASAASGYGVWYATDAHWRAKYATLERDSALSSTLATEAMRQLEKSRRERAEAANQVSALESELLAERFRNSTREVYTYAQSPDRDNDCTIGSDWLRIHDAAALLPTCSGDSAAACVGDAAPRSAGDVLVTVERNYQQCATWHMRLVAMQRYANSLPEPEQE